VTRHADPARWAGFRDPSGPDTFAGTCWWAVALLLASLVLCSWDVLPRLREAEAELAARGASAAGYDPPPRLRA
jgi:hypothetical protein